MLRKHHLANKIVGLTVGAVLAILTLFFVFSFSYMATFSHASHVPIPALWGILTGGWSQRKSFTDKSITFLILGLDKRDDALEKTLLTDTIILAGLNTTTNNLTLLPLPRDVWIHDYKTKINALYFYGGTQLTKSVVEQLTGTTIDYYVVLDYQKLPGFVDTLEGIPVDVEKSFTDDRYPNPYYTGDGGNVPAYVTIAFEQGIHILTGEQTLQYVRSRGSEDTSEGSDEGRSRRQLQVVQGIFDRIKNKNVLINPGATGTLYDLWKTDVDTNISDHELIGLAAAIGPRSVTIRSLHIPTSADEANEPILTHPPISTYGLWVWELSDITGEKLKTFVKEHMGN